MANLSQMKRDRMITFLNQIRAEHSTDDMLIALGEIENEIVSKKYGLLWEEHQEAVDEAMKESIPVFKEDDSREIIASNGPMNFILEGDNLHSLYLLEKTCREKVDCIYIDPPYNTGAKDWKYNNNYVDKNDSYRHSKWLSMMNARLKIAKKLLKSDGVLVCAIDENELGTTLLLLDDIFGPAYAIDPITVVHNPRGVQGDNFSYVNEYAIFVYKRGSKVIENCSIKEEDIDWRDLRDNGHESLRSDAATCFYAINVTPNGEIVGFGPNMTHEADFHPKRNVINEDGTISIYPIDVKGIERKWRYNTESVPRVKHLLRVKKIGETFDIELGKDYAPYRTVWTDKKFDANEHGTQLINAMVPNNDFSFPKSVHNVYECLRAVTLYRPDALILDFFAGSGTTGHATLMLNQELGGNRRFILCTNNDVGEKKEKEFEKTHPNFDPKSEDWIKWCDKYGIASSVTYPRIKAAIQGFTHNKDFKVVLYQQKITPSVIRKPSKLNEAAEQIEKDNIEKYDQVKWVVEDNTLKVLGITKKGAHVAGIPGNLKYYKTQFISKSQDFLSEALLEHTKEMVELEHGVKVDGSQYVLILDDDAADKLEANFDSMKLLKGIYVSKKVMLTAVQNKKFAQVPIHIIPDYYFDFEMREIGESW